MRKIIAYLATSADGFIARPDGDVGWLDRQKGSYGMAAFYNSVDTVLLGRKTFDVGRKFGQPVFIGKKNYVFSRRLKTSPHPDIELVNGDVRELARRLRRRRGKDIWLVGGADLMGRFLDEGQIDELVVHLMPTLIGQGIPLLAPRHREVPLRLTSTRKYPDGVVRLSYTVPRRKIMIRPVN